MFIFIVKCFGGKSGDFTRDELPNPFEKRIRESE